MFKFRINHSVLFFYVLCTFPMLYFVSAMLENKSLYIIKDLLLVLILLLSLFWKKYTKATYITVAFFLVINIYALFLSYDDIIFYILSVREFFFYPLVGVLLGTYFSKHSKFEKYFYKFMLISLFLTYLYLVLFPLNSFGPTFRLKSFWDREHEPAIVAGITLIWTVYSELSKKGKLFLIFLSIVIMLLSASRSILLSVFLIMVLINIKNFSIGKILVLGLIASVVILNFSSLSLSGRKLDHNLNARTSQYTLAVDNLTENNFLGLGTDKYGVVGNIQKEFCYKGHCTTTMDSSLLKYTLNYGSIFIVSFLIFLFVLGVYFLNIRTKLDKKVFGTIVFGLLLGAVTGKMGAFPLNLILYMNIGVMIYHLNNTTKQLKNKKNETSLICS